MSGQLQLSNFKDRGLRSRGQKNLKRKRIVIRRIWPKLTQSLDHLPFLVCKISFAFQINHEDSKSNPIELRDASFSWNDSAGLSLNECSLQNVTWKVSEGSLVAVVGTVGSGKSSLLSALLGDMIRVRGEANIKGKIAYVPQQAWMQNATLKNNILFGRTYQRELYEKVNWYVSKTQFRARPFTNYICFLNRQDLEYDRISKRKTRLRIHLNAWPRVLTLRFKNH